MNRQIAFFSFRRYGFYVTLFSSLLGIVAAVVYLFYYKDYATMMSYPAVITLIALSVLSIILSLPRVTAKWAAIPVAIGALLALLFYIRVMYNYVTVVMVSIDLAGFSPQFILCSVLFILTLVLTTANIFFSQVKEEQANA